jgi:hypothetical protein
MSSMVSISSTDFLDADQPVPDPALPNHVPGGYVVSDTVDPGSEGTSLVEIGEAAPEVEMDILKQVPTASGSSS